MLSSTIDQIHDDIPAAAVAVPSGSALGRASAPCSTSVTRGRDRLVFGGLRRHAVDGIFTTGLEAHAAVRMHVNPATGAFWSYDQNCPKRMATPSGAGRLRAT